MKKGISILLIILQLMCLVACDNSDTSKKLEKSAKKFIGSIKVYDFDNIREQLVKEEDFSEFQNNINHFMKNKLGKRKVEDEEIKKDNELKEHMSNYYKDAASVMDKNEIKEIENKFFSYLQICASKMTYEIEEVDTDNMMAKVNFKYIDTSDIVDRIVKDSMDIVYEDGNKDYDNTAKKLQQTLEKQLTQAYNDVRDERASGSKCINKSVYIKFDKSNDYKVENIDDDLKEIISFNTCNSIDKNIEKNEEDMVKAYKDTRKKIEEDLKN